MSGPRFNNIVFFFRIRSYSVAENLPARPVACSGSARPSGSAWPSRAFPKSIGGVGEPLRHNQPSGPSEFELGRGLPQELGRASIMEESAPLFYVCPRLRPRRGLHRRSGGDDDAGAPAASRPPLAAGSAAGGGQRRAPRSPPRRRRASHAPAGFAAGRSGCASDLGPLLGGQPDARDAGPAVSRCVCGL